MLTIENVYTRRKQYVQTIKQLFKDKKVINFTNLPRNVFTEGDPTSKDSMRSVHTEGLHYEFILFVSQQNPDLKFYTECRTEGLLRGGFVFKEDECLGEIRQEHTPTEHPYALGFYNDRIYNDVQKGECKKTTKLNVAKKIFTNYFYGLTVLERMITVKEKVRVGLNDDKWERERNHKKVFDELQLFVKEEFRKQDSKFIEYLVTTPKEELIKRYKDVTAHKKLTEGLEKHVKNKEGFYVLLQGDEYHLWGDDSTIVKRCKRTDLSSDILTALGLLKVAEAKTVMEGVGFKISDNSFYILKEVTLEFDD
jgi:archaeosine-15-forming tRNA-guanine transglycosylase